MTVVKDGASADPVTNIFWRRLVFLSRRRVRLRGSAVTSDAGLLAYRVAAGKFLLAACDRASPRDDRAFNIMQDRLTRMRLAGDPPDVQITPHIGHIGWLDFHRAEEAIAAGKAATETALEPIEATIAALA